MLQCIYLLFLLFSHYSCNNNTALQDNSDPITLLTLTNSNSSEFSPLAATLETAILTEDPSLDNSTLIVHKVDIDGDNIVETNQTITSHGLNTTTNQTITPKSSNSTNVFNYFYKTFFNNEGTGIDGNCTVSSDCGSSDLQCLNGICKCQKGYVADVAKLSCLKTATELKQDCTEDAQCYVGMNLQEGDVLCLSFKCTCNVHQTVPRNKTCVRTIYVGDKCLNNSDCLATNSECVQGVCACQSDLIPSPDNKRCLPAMKTLSSSCTEDIQCQHHLGDNAICTNDLCVCKPGYRSNSTFCVPYLKLGESCMVTSDCVTEPLDNEPSNTRDCINNECACTEGFKEVAGENVCLSSAHHLFSSITVVSTMLFIATLRIYS